MQMHGWTPKTTLLLRCPFSPSTASHRTDAGYFSDGHGGFDVIDHAFGRAFPSELLGELRANGWVDDPARGVGGRLRPARTKTDADVDALLRAFVGAVADGSKSGTRGDVSAFVPRNERAKDSFRKRHPRLHRLVSSIEITARRRLGKPANGDTFDGKTYFEFDSKLTSVQIAKYPGDGRAGYPRHCDRGAMCTKEPIYNANAKHASKENPLAERLLTFVYYLTPPGWDTASDGGALRMHSPIEESGNISESNASHFDVTPHADRLVVFRSDLIEHEVVPSLRRDRVAVTVWLYGQVRQCSSTGQGGLLSRSFASNRLENGQLGVIEHRGGCALPPPLPILADDSTTTESARERIIFVAIPSYRDKETWPTIRSLIETARHPDRVHVGVVFQLDTNSPEEVRSLMTAEGSGVSMESLRWSRETNFRSVTLDYRHATGPCFARRLCQTLHRGEDYVLQIDSHMRFRLNWDEYLIRQLNKTGRPDKSLLTAYPPGYEPPNGPGPDAETRATILVPWKFGREDGMLRQKGRLLRTKGQRGPDDNIPCLLYAGGFNFFHSSILDVCPYENLHGLFFGEEISMAVRLYTHGVDLYAPPQTVCYHLWERSELRARGGGSEAKQRGNSLEAVHMQLLGVGRGLGRERSADRFCKELGVDFEKRTLAPGCENAGLGDEAFASLTFLGALKDNAETCQAFNGDDMSSVLKLIGQCMNET